MQKVDYIVISMGYWCHLTCHVNSIQVSPTILLAKPKEFLAAIEPRKLMSVGERIGVFPAGKHIDPSLVFLFENKLGHI